MAKQHKATWKTPPELWAKLKLLAREKRHAPTEAERVLWQRLRNRQVGGLKFRRQHSIGPFIVDFYAPEVGLVVEVDGGIHQYTAEEDAIRQEYLEARGLRVLRLTNEDVLAGAGHVLDAILQEAGERRLSV